MISLTPCPTVFLVSENVGFSFIIPFTNGTLFAVQVIIVVLIDPVLGV